MIHVLRSVLQMALTMLAATLIVFCLGRLTGDPVTLLVPIETPRERYDELRQQLGLDRPLPVQYLEFVRNLATGDLGQSIRLRRPVTHIIAETLPRSLALAAVAMIMAVAIGFPLGILAAVRHLSFWDTLARSIAVLGQSVPPFLLGILLIIVFSVWLRVLPSAGSDGPLNYLMPAFTIAWFVSAGIVRLLRSSMLEVLSRDYVGVARAKGLTERTVILRHALRNAAIPVVTFLGIMLGIVIVASVVVEVVFTWLGIGRAAYESVIQRDFPLMQGIVLVLTAVVLVINTLVDILYVWLDPRLRHGR